MLWCVVFYKRSPKDGTCKTVKIESYQVRFQSSLRRRRPNAVLSLYRILSRLELNNKKTINEEIYDFTETVVAVSCLNRVMLTSESWLLQNKIKLSDKTCEKLITRKVLCFLSQNSKHSTRYSMHSTRTSVLESFEDR